MGSLFSIFSCSNTDESSLNDTQSKNVNYALKEIDSPNNKQNKWDICGIMHNNILRAVVDNKKNLEKNADAYIDYSLNQFHSMYDPNYSISTMTTQEIRIVMSDSTNYYVNVIENNINYTPVVKANLNEFFVIIRNSLTEEDLTYNILKKKIIDYEDKIIKSSLNQADIDEILKVTSVARHSFYFWNKELGQTQENSILGKRPFWKWLVVGFADVAGAAAGATAGSLTGVLAVAGGVAGAAGASSGASSLVDWISPDAP